jgi:hypothetical protein
MKRAIAALVLSAASASASAQATGNDWIQWDASRKAAYIEGIISGSSSVASNSIVPASLFPNGPIRQRAETVWQSASNEFKQALSSQKAPPTKYNAADMMLYSMFDGLKKNSLYERAMIKTSPDAIVQGLNQLFNDAKNRIIKLNDATYLVKKQIEGAPEEDIQALLPYLRGEEPVPAGWIVPIKDPKTGKVRVVEFP